MKKKKHNLTVEAKLFLIVLLIPASVIIYYLLFISYDYLNLSSVFQFFSKSEMDIIQEDLDMKIPEEYIPLYIEVGEQYNVPWTLLAAHHRVETRFSTMSTLISPVGAEGHMQFMPCTFVGWDHPTCEGVGEGDIPKEDKTNPKVISKYGGYGVDANHDGVADPFDIEDAIYSAANFLSKSGASKGKIKQAIYQYNHDNQYVKEVYTYYEQYEKIRADIEKAVLMANK